MLKVISTKQVRLGMFIQELKGPWIDHPFWNKAFKLEDPEDLKKLQVSVIKQVVIDTSKGLDVAELKVQELVVSAAEPSLEIKPISKPKRTSTAEEQERAKKVIKASKSAVASMFHEVRMGKAVSAEAALQLVDDIAASVARNEGALISLVRLKTKMITPICIQWQYVH
jgi:hypothetical protein